MSIDYVIEYN